MPLDAPNLQKLGVSPQNIEFLRGLDTNVSSKQYFTAQQLASATQVTLFTADKTINSMAILATSQSGSPTLQCWITKTTTANSNRFANAVTVVTVGTTVNVPKMVKDEKLIVQASDANVSVQDIDR